ncbi:LysM peptidoglycan-binding domain-containing protein [Thermus oshimai]|uniref:C40 family peptidase n=1 Tax=Thermus oshimai TaxID=56957 RepID=UPI0039A6C4EB
MRLLLPFLLGLALAQGELTHVVAPGETLFSIARRYGTTVEELQRLNGLSDFLIRPGQVLKVGPAQAPTHVVAAGETLFSIARRYGTTVEALKALNGLQDETLKVGQVLRLPSTAPEPPGAPSGAPLEEEEALDPESPLLRAVLRYLGVPYRYGANSPLALDCSAFVAQVYAELGVGLPRTTKEQWNALPQAEGLKPGDLVFFSFGGREVDHVGVYLGRGVFAHASSYGSRVVIESLEAPFYQKAYRGARRPPLPQANR